MRRSVIVGILALLCSSQMAVGEIEIVDAQGTHRFNAPPERIVTLSWALAEQVIELGVNPVAVADVDGYRTWVVQPAVPDGVANTGLRDSPNFERIAEVSPDVILIGDRQAAFIPQLSRIAPVLHFEVFSEDHDNPALARETYLTLARLLRREAHARARLAALDIRLADLAAAL